MLIRHSLIHHIKTHRLLCVACVPALPNQFARRFAAQCRVQFKFKSTGPSQMATDAVTKHVLSGQASNSIILTHYCYIPPLAEIEIQIAK